MSKPNSMAIYQNSQYSRVMNSKYKYKLKKLKQQIKNFVFENAAICDEVSYIQAELAVARDERRYLLKRLMRMEEFENNSQEQVENENIQPQKDKETKQQQVKEAKFPKKRGPKKRSQNSKSSGRSRDTVTLDENGKPRYPLNLCNILIHSPGEIIPLNPNFHTAHWIYPVGYVATRIYAHPRDPQRKCVYTCKILNNAGVPQFQIIPDNDLDSVFFGATANACHQDLLETLKRSLSDIDHLPLNVQGEKFFGLNNSTVKSLMELDEGFKQCANFEGFNDVSTGNFPVSEENDPTMSYEALQSLIAMSAYHTLPEVKEEPPDELLDVN